MREQGGESVDEWEGDHRRAVSRHRAGLSSRPRRSATQASGVSDSHCESREPPCARSAQR